MPRIRDMYRRMCMDCRVARILIIILISLCLNFLLLAWMRRLQHGFHDDLWVERSRTLQKGLRSHLQATIDTMICGRERAVFFNGSTSLYVANWRSPSESIYSFRLLIITAAKYEQLLLAEWDKEELLKGDFLVVYIRSGYLVLVFDPGRALTELVHPHSLPRNRWFDVHVWRKDKQAGLTIDNVSVTTDVQGVALAVNSNSGLYIGGVPEGHNVPDVLPLHGFLGCAIDLKLNNHPRSLMKLMQSKQ